MASGWNLWVWLPCIVVVSGCCCKEIYRYPHNNYKFSLLHLYYIALFLSAASLLLCSFFKCFFGLYTINYNWHLVLQILLWLLTIIIY